MQSNLHTYQQCLSVYSIWIKSNIDQDQKDYYKVNPEKPDVPLNKNDAFQKVQKRHVQEKR